MIQPLKPARNSWVVEWSQFDEEPALVNGCVLLPVVTLVVDASELEVIGHIVLPEVDQRQIESLLSRLLQNRPSPREILIPARDDWNHPAWNAFAADFRTTIEFYHTSKAAQANLPNIVRTTRKVKGRFSRQILQPLREECTHLPASKAADALIETARRLYSPARRLAHLEAAITLCPQHPHALLELADHHFQQGNTDAANQRYNELFTIEARRWRKTTPKPAWWADPETRPLLRARYGLMMCEWHRGEWDESLHHATCLLKLNPTDNQGVRFLIPLLHLLADNLPAALDFFQFYEKNYPKDYHEPSFLFAWGLALAADGHEKEARQRYRQGILRNLYIAPGLLDLPEPPHTLWHPSDRAEPDYAYAFLDSYATLWERDHAALRFLRDTYEEIQPLIASLINLRQRMADFQDERYDPNHKTTWNKLLEEENAILHSVD